MGQIQDMSGGAMFLFEDLDDVDGIGDATELSPVLDASMILLDFKQTQISTIHSNLSQRQSSPVHSPLHKAVVPTPGLSSIV